MNFLQGAHKFQMPSNKKNKKFVAVASTHAMPQAMPHVLVVACRPLEHFA